MTIGELKRQLVIVSGKVGQLRGDLREAEAQEQDLRKQIALMGSNLTPGDRVCFTQRGRPAFGYFVGIRFTGMGTVLWQVHLEKKDGTPGKALREIWRTQPTHAPKEAPKEPQP